MSDTKHPPALKTPSLSDPARAPQQIPPPLLPTRSSSSDQDSSLVNTSIDAFAAVEEYRSWILASIALGLALLLMSLILFAFFSSNAGNGQKGAGTDQASMEVEGTLASGQSQSADQSSGEQASQSSSSKESESDDLLANAAAEQPQSNDTSQDSTTNDEEAILTKVPNRQPQYSSPTRSGGITGSTGGSNGIDLSSTKGINPFVGEGKKSASTVFVIDVSSSMLGDSKLPRVLSALTRAIDQLDEDQQFCVILFDNAFYVEPSVNGLIKASKRNKLLIQNWLINPPRGGGTDPMAAMPQAIALAPERIVLLSDGEFDPTNVVLITSLNKQRFRPARIDCVGLMEDVQVLRDIAQQNRGVYYQAW